MAEERRARAPGSKERILRAAVHVASVHGYGGTTIKRISEESGLPPSSLYWHFGNKDRLLAAALEHGFQEWGRGLRVRDEPHADLEQAVRRRLRGGLRAVVETPAAWQLGLMLSLQTPVQAVEAREAFLAVHGRAVEGLAAWWMEVLPADVADPALARRLSASLLAVLDGLYVAHASGLFPDLEAVADRFARGIVAHVERLRERAA